MGARYPIIRGIGAFQGSAGSITHTIGGTSGISEIGDLILIFLESANQAFTAPVGGGYSEVTSSPQGTGTAGAANATRLTIFYKISDGTETTYVTGDSGDHNGVASLVISGVDELNPINVTAGGTGAAATSISCSTVTTTRQECLIINAVGTDYDATSTAVFASATNANLTNITERIDGATAQQSGGGIGVYTGQKGTAGSTGNTTISYTTPISEEFGQITIAIAPQRKQISIT